MTQVTEENFTNYFHAADGTYKPTKGQILARWRAVADFVDGDIKRNVVESLCSSKIGAETSRQIMRKLVQVQDRDSVKVLLEMAQDLADGMSIEEVCKKPYRMVVEQFYWTEKQHVPDDPHWEIINIRDLREDKDLEFSFKAGELSQ